MKHHKYTKEQIEFIADNVKGRGNKELTEMFNAEFGLNLKSSQIKSFKSNHSLSSGLTGKFKKGHEPWNKGKTGLNIGGEETQFKKGHKPYNWVPLGTERIGKDGYIEVKVQDGKLQKNWKGKHIMIWEERNGPVPEGHVVIFGDRNIRNFDIDNLILVSRYQLLTMNRNGLIKEDAELTKTGVIIADLHQKICDRR